MCRTPAETGTLSEESDYSGKNESMSYGDAHQSFDDSKEFNISDYKANQRSKGDMSNGAHVTQLDAVHGFTVVVDGTPWQKTEYENTSPQVTGDISFSRRFGGGTIEEKHLWETLSNPRNSNDDSMHTFGTEPQVGYGDNGSHPSETFVTVSEISLRTQPSPVPPPLRPPPTADVIKGDSSRSASQLKANKNYVFEGTAGGSSAGSSPPFFDVEVDASSSAAVSAAAMKEAMEKAQAKLKNAKELMERRKEGLQSRSKLGSKNDAKHKEGKSSNISNSLKDQRVQGSFETSKNLVKEEIQKEMKTTQVLPDSREGEPYLNVAKTSAEGRQGKESWSSHESYKTEGTGKWKEAAEFYELVRGDKSRKEQANNEKVSVKTKVANEGKHKEKKAVIEPFELLEENDKKINAAGEACGWKENEQRSAEEPSEWEGSRGKLKAAKEVCRPEEYEKVEVAQMFRGWKENDKTWTVGLEHEEIEHKLNVADEWEEHDILIEIQQKENEVEVKEAIKQENERKLKEAKERTGNDRKLKKARENEKSEQRLKEALGLEETEKKLKVENEKNKKEAREREENARRLKVALDWEENEKKQKEAREREENEKKQKDAREREENEKKLKEAHEREENEKKLKQAIEWEENEKRLIEALKQEQVLKRQKEACEREENEKRLKEALERGENVKKQKVHEKRLKEACEREEIEKKLKDACEREETERKRKDVQRQAEGKKRLNETHERKETEKRLEEMPEWGETDKRLKEATKLEESKKRHGISSDVEEMKGLKKANDQIVNENEKNLKFCQGACMQMKENSFKATDEACRLHENKNVQAAQLAHKYEVNSSEANQVALGDGENGKIAAESQGIHKNYEAVEVENVLVEEIFEASGMADRDAEQEKDMIRMDYRAGSVLWDENVKRSLEAGIGIGQSNLEKNLRAAQMASNPEDLKKNFTPEWGERDKSVKQTPVSFELEDGMDKFRSSQVSKEWVEIGKKAEAAQAATSEGKGNTEKAAQQVSDRPTEKKEKNINVTLTLEEREREERMKRERELEKERLRKLEEEREREREREKDRMAIDGAPREARDRAYVEAREKAERAAVEKATAEARQRALTEARERLEKACAEAREKTFSDKTSIEARLRAERASIERATSEARERAFERAMAEKAVSDARERMERSVSDKFSASSRNSGIWQSSSSSVSVY